MVKLRIGIETRYFGLHLLFRAGDNADSLFVVLSGRLRSVEKKTVIEEFGRGDVLGMVFINGNLNIVLHSD